MASAPTLQRPSRGQFLNWALRNPEELEKWFHRVEQLSNMELFTGPVGGAVTRRPLTFARENASIDLPIPDATPAGDSPDLSGFGDVFGPGSSGAGNIALFGNATGKLIRDSGLNLDDLISDGEDFYTDVVRGAAFPLSSSSSSFTAIPFDTAVNNHAAIWNASSPTRLTVTQPGRYQLTGFVYYDINVTGVRACYLRLNGGAVVSITSCAANVSGLGTYLAIPGLADLVAGDYVELLAQQASGGTLNVINAEARLVKLNVRGLNSGSGGGADFTKIVCAFDEVVCANDEVVWIP